VRATGEIVELNARTLKVSPYARTILKVDDITKEDLEVYLKDLNDFTNDYIQKLVEVGETEENIYEKN
jgi:hypothetical protein